MADDIFKGMWKQIKGSAREAWGKLTDDDLTEIDGRREKMVGKLQERYGWSHDKAEMEVDNFLQRHNFDTDINPLH